MLGSLLVAAQLSLIAVLVWRSGAALESPWIVSGLSFSAVWLLWAVWSMPRKTLKVHPSPAGTGVLCRDRAYRLVRHPMYGAVLLAALLVAWADGGWLTLVCWMGLFLVLWAKSSLEEKWLGERYPEYENFKLSTTRWIPLWPMGNSPRVRPWMRPLENALIILAAANLVWHAYESAWDATLFDDKTGFNIHAREATELIDSDTGLLILDVRSEWEFSGQRLPGAVNISIDDPAFDKKLSKELAGKSSILIYCAGGYRSRKGVGRIQQQGVTLPIYHLHRGMLEWWWR